MQATESLSNEEQAADFWGQKNDKIGETIIRMFSHDSFNLLSKNVPDGIYFFVIIVFFVI